MTIKQIYQKRLDFIKESTASDDQQRSTPSEQLEGGTRRLTRGSFIKLGLGALSALAVLEIGGISLYYLRPRQREVQYSGVVTAGAVDEFPPGSVTAFQQGNFYLVRTQDGGFLALCRRCPHLGCSVNYDAELQGFQCPCHASSFDFHGDYESPPVPRALDAFEITIEDGQVMVNTARLQRRDHFAPEQLVHHIEGS